MKTLMKTLMIGENSRNLWRRTKRQLRALVNLRPDKTPAQGVHDSNHEGFMMPKSIWPGWFALSRRQVMRTDKTPGHRVHDCDHEPFTTPPHPLISEIARPVRGVELMIARRTAAVRRSVR